MTLASARDSIRLLSWLKSNAAHVQPIVVANRVHSGLQEISKADFEASIERKIDYTIPFDIKAAINCAKLGQTFVEANRATKAGAIIREIGLAVTGISDVEKASSVAEPPKKSLLGKLDLKSMLPKKDKKLAKVN
jgi:pilus assembly protein CpaE